MIVADTNVVSELMRMRPTPVAIEWFESQSRLDLRLTAVTVAELLCGLARLPQGARRTSLEVAIEGLLQRFADDILAFDDRSARHYAAIVAARERHGRPIAVFDAQIAATCRVHGAVLATRNVKDFTGLDLDLVNPWG